MKAFGARLTAGAAIIFLGAIMAAQAQRDNQDSAQSSWSTEAIPDGSSPAPIGSGDLLPAMLSQTQSWTGESLGEIDAAPLGDASGDAPASAVRLVQHTEGAGSMSLPESDEGSASVPGAPAMPMQFPSFDGVMQSGEQPSESAQAPSMAMGIPDDGPANTAGEASAKSSAVKFADSPVESFQQQTEDDNVLHGQAPANGLRGSFPPLREELNASAEAPSSRSAAAPPSDLGSAGPALATTASSDSGPEVTSSSDPAAGVPAAMLTPVIPGAEADAAPEFAAAPRATMQLTREPAAITEPQITGQGSDAGSTTQRVAGIGDEGYAQSAGGFGVPANYGMPGGNAAASQPKTAAQPPALPAPSMAGQAPAGQNQSRQMLSATPATTAGSPFGGAQAQTASAPMGNQSIYHGVGHKERGPAAGANGPLPAGPSLASPGDRILDGPQSPSILIQKVAPPEVKVGKTATFKIQVKNVGGSPALDVVVKDRVPTGMEIVDATPRPNPNFQPELVWMLGDMEPGQEHTITLQLTPLQEGTLGSVARVSFNAAASVRTTSTRPELKVVQKARNKVPVGQQLEIELEVSNPGSGEATGVVMQEDVPAGLKHPQGKELDNLIGTLGPGETRRQVLRMQAVQPGLVQNTIRVKGDDGLEATHTIDIEVIAPQLQVGLSGPTRRYLERQATFYLEIANVGTDVARNVDISVQLDRGFTFVSTDFEGQYDSSRHAVFWSLPSLPVGESGRVPLTLLPVKEGARVIRTEAKADMNISASNERQVAVDSLAELTFSIHDSADPVEVGGESIYEIRVNNSGSRDDTNVRVQIALPPGMQLAQQQGDFQEIQPGVIEFATRALLKANDEVVYQVKALGRTPGRHKVKAIVTSDQSDVPVTKEESIMVYADQ